MATLHNLHVDVDLSEFTSTSGTVTADAAAAMAGTAKGLKVVVTGGTAAYGIITLGANKTLIHGRIYFDPNSAVMQANVVALKNSLDNLVACIGFYEDTNWYIYGYYVTDTADGNTPDVLISDGPHWIEYEWKASTGAGANNGYLKIWIDKNTGAADSSTTSLDNDTLTTSTIRYGAVGGIVNTGTFYMDELITNDDGGVIGPYGSAMLLRAIEKY
jgi:hypothetical protein